MKLKYLILVCGLLFANLSLAGSGKHKLDISSFSDETLQMILSHVKASDLSNIGLVNYRWRNNSQDKYFLMSYFKTELAALAEMDQKQFDRAQRLLFLSAKTLNPKAMFELLRLVDSFDLFFSENILSLYRKAAQPKGPKRPKTSRESSDPLALTNLGIIYYYGLGVGMDEKKAVNLFEAASSNECAEGQYYLAHAYEYGNGIQKNPEKAVEWYTHSAKKGYSRAQNDLGYIYLEGLHNIETNYQKAFNLFLLSSSQGDPCGHSNLGHMYRKGKFVERDYEQAAHFYELGARQGNGISENNLAYLFERGLGVEKNLEKAVELYQRAVRHGSKEAKRALARLGR